MIQLVQPIDEKYAFCVERGKMIGSAVLLDIRWYTAYTTSHAAGDMGAIGVSTHNRLGTSEVAHVLDGWPLHVKSMEAVTDVIFNLGVATEVARRYMGGTWPPRAPLEPPLDGGRGGKYVRGYPLPLGDPRAWPPGKFFANRRKKIDVSGYIGQKIRVGR
jgi:hypothetical protein